MSDAGQGLCQAWALGGRSGYGFLFWRLVGPLVVIFHRSAFINFVLSFCRNHGERAAKCCRRA